MRVRTLSRFAALTALLASALSSVASAQKRPAKPTTPPAAPQPAATGKASVIGVVTDSLNGGFLTGAEILVQGAKGTALTDSLGKFKVEGLDPGTYQVGVFHPLLDSLGISLATQPFHVGPDSVSFVTLSVPSSATIISQSCTRGPRRMGNSAIIGHVENPDTHEPVSHAEVSVAWVEVEVTKQFGFRRTPRLLKDSTDATGAFRLCGLPNSLEATLQARRGNSVTAEVPVNLGDDPAALFVRTLLLSSADSGAKTGTAAVSGRVVLEGSVPVAGTRVEVVGTDAVTTTNERGQFSFKNLPSGTHVLIARHLGYTAQMAPVDLSSRETPNVTIKLPKFVAALDPVIVKARKGMTLDRTGFTQRSRGGAGYFIGPERLAQMNPVYVTDVLRTVPGLHVSYGPNGETVSSSRGSTSLTGSGGCVQFFVDDMPWQSLEPGDINQFINGHEIVAVEVYSGPSTPGQYARSGCDATVLLWTRTRVSDYNN